MSQQPRQPGTFPPPWWAIGMGTAFLIPCVALGRYSGLWWGVALFMAIVTIVMTVVLGMKMFINAEEISKEDERWGSRMLLLLLILTIVLIAVAYLIHGSPVLE